MYNLLTKPLYTTSVIDDYKLKDWLFLSLWTFPGFTLFASWIPFQHPYLLIVGWVLIFYANDVHSNRPVRFLLMTYVNIFIWNALSNYWLLSTNSKGALFVFLINPLILSIPFFILTLTKKHSAELSYFLFIACWLSIEYLHFSWELGFPNMTLGYGLASLPFLIQWYDLTGVQGGSLWILTLSILFYEYLKNTKHKRMLVYSLLVLIAPMGYSLAIFISYQESGKKIEVVAIHPNIDNRMERSSLTNMDIINRFSGYTKEEGTANTAIIIWPENSITVRMQDSKIDAMTHLVMKKAMLDFPQASVVTGTIVNHITDGPLDFFSKHSSGEWFHTYNAVLQFSLENNDKTPMRTKQKLVPVEETIPYPEVLGGFSDWVGSLGNFRFTRRENELSVFEHGGDKFVALVCYESFFPEPTRTYVSEGAEFLFVLLNEGWYRNLYAARQTLYFSVIRAIENRRSIARSSNAGITSFIDQLGQIEKTMEKFEGAALRHTIVSNGELSFFSRNGNYIGKIAILSFVLGIVYLVISNTFILSGIKNSQA